MPIVRPGTPLFLPTALNAHGSWGSYGITVRDLETGAELILTAAHCVGALAPEYRPNAVAYTGDVALRVGYERVGRVVRTIPTEIVDSCLVDAAVIEPHHTVECRRAAGRGALRRQTRPIGEDDVAVRLYKRGARTGLTEGELWSPDETALLRLRQAPPLWLEYESVFAVVGMENTAFAARGDSGSVVFDEHNAIVGLVIGHDEADAGDGLAFCLPIDLVLEALAVSI